VTEPPPDPPMRPLWEQKRRFDLHLPKPRPAPRQEPRPRPARPPSIEPEVQKPFVAALILAVALFGGAAFEVFYHPSASYDGQSGQCVSAWDRMTDNVQYTHFTTQLGLDGNIACSHRVDVMDHIADYLVVGGVVLVIIAFAWRRTHRFRGLST
jgi:hypothetical protein